MKQYRCLDRKTGDGVLFFSREKRRTKRKAKSPQCLRRKRGAEDKKTEGFLSFLPRKKRKEKNQKKSEIAAMLAAEEGAEGKKTEVFLSFLSRKKREEPRERKAWSPQCLQRKTEEAGIRFSPWVFLPGVPFGGRSLYGSFGRGARGALPPRGGSRGAAPAARRGRSIFGRKCGRAKREVKKIKKAESGEVSPVFPQKEPKRPQSGDR